MRKRIRAVAVALLLWGAIGVRAEPLPVVVAVDVSRSVEPGELGRGLGELAVRLRALDAEIPVGLLAFADRPEWVVPLGGTPGEVADAVVRLAPTGRHTLLHDALFVAARALPEGGTVLVVTDGRDENSATTVEDVARIADSHRVRVLTVSVGRRVDDRVLRRLALLTGGAHLGDVRALDTAALVAERSVEPGPTLVPEAPPPAAADEEEMAARPWRLLALVAMVVVSAALAAWWLIRRRRHEPRRCEVCGSELEPWETSCSACEIESIEKEVRTAPVALPVPAVEAAPNLDPSVFVKDELPPGLDVTLTLGRTALLLTSQAGQPPRAYQLPAGQVFTVGRAPAVNSLVVSDPAISGQHFKLVPKDDDWYVVDLGTTNGTTVERERIRVRKLESGNIIRAGTTEFTFEIRTRGLNYDTRDPVAPR